MKIKEIIEPLKKGEFCLKKKELKTRSPQTIYEFKRKAVEENVQEENINCFVLGYN